MANLIIWRHAEAEELSASGLDADRALTARGVKNADKMARWLEQHLPENYAILSSPARRCLQTAAALQQVSGKKKPHALNIAPFLATHGSVAVMVEHLVKADSDQTMVVVGHQPQLGEFIARLLGMTASACTVKKGAVWWLRQRAKAELDSPVTGNTAADASARRAAETSAFYIFAVKPPRY